MYESKKNSPSNSSAMVCLEFTEFRQHLYVFPLLNFKLLENENTRNVGDKNNQTKMSIKQLRNERGRKHKSKTKMDKCKVLQFVYFFVQIKLQVWLTYFRFCTTSPT